MLIKILRTQTTAIGTLRMGQVYDLSADEHAPVAASLLDRKMAKKLTKNQAAEAQIEHLDAAYRVNDEAAEDDDGPQVIDDGQ